MGHVSHWSQNVTHCQLWAQLYRPNLPAIHRINAYSQLCRQHFRTPAVDLAKRASYQYYIKYIKIYILKYIKEYLTS